MPDWKAVEDHIRAAVNQFRRDQAAVNPNDPDSLLSFNQRALFMAGKINGAEWLLNEFTAAQQEEQNLRDQIKETEQENLAKKIKQLSAISSTGVKPARGLFT